MVDPGHVFTFILPQRLATSSGSKSLNSSPRPVHVMKFELPGSSNSATKNCHNCNVPFLPDLLKFLEFKINNWTNISINISIKTNIEKTYIGCCSFSFNARACEACAACWACCAAAAADRSIGRADAAVWLLITSTPGSDLTLSPAPPRPRVDNEAPPSGLLNSWIEQCYVYERMYPWISFLKLKRYNLSV